MAAEGSGREWWRQDESFSWLGGVPVAVYTSKRTGLRLCVAQVEGPIVSGFFTLATEAVATEYSHPDDGLPHCLEHLIFMGSEQFPYKGALDQLANRCLAGGTNAWTDVDHTAYTLTTAGSDGFLNLMPVYLDHILNPLLTPEGFITEVHHLQQDGHDAGVIYAEIQARENSCDNLTDRKLLEGLFPGSAYSAEAMGLMRNVRRLTIDQVRRYHQDYYRSDNICVIVTGQIDATHIIDALLPVEERILAKRASPPSSPPRPRPWSSPAKPLDEGATLTVPFPSVDEASGRVLLGWRGPAWNDFETTTALRVMWLYLTGSSVSPAYQAFVEHTDPYCGGIDFTIGELSPTYSVVAFEDASTDKLKLIHPRFMQLVRHAAGHVDLARLGAVIARERRNVLNAIESHPHYSFATAAISTALYGQHGSTSSSLRRYLSTLERLDALPASGLTAHQFWGALMRDWVVNAPCVVVVGVPSASLAKDMAVSEMLRVQQQQQALGSDALAQRHEQLRAATCANEVAPPVHLLESIPVPSLSSLSAIPVMSVRHSHVHDAAESDRQGWQAVQLSTSGSRRGAGTQYGSHTGTATNWVVTAAAVSADAYKTSPEGSTPGGGNGGGRRQARQLKPQLTRVLTSLAADRFKAGSLPTWLQWDHVKTSHATVTAALDTQDMPPRLRPYCSLFVSCILELPLKLPNGGLMTHEEVVSQLMDASVSARASIGLHGGSLQCGSFSQLLILTLTFEARRYPSAVKWLKRLLLETKFTPDRLMIAVNKLAAQIPALSRQGHVMAQQLLHFELYGSHSNQVAASLLRQQRFLAETAARLLATPAEVVRDVEEFRAFVTQPHRMRFHIAADMLRVSHPASSWVAFFGEALASDDSPVLPVPHAKTQLKPSVVAGDRSSRASSVLAVLPSTETSELVLATSCIDSFLHDDFPAILIAIEYLTALEGDFWKKIRGFGLAYGYNIKCRPEHGTIEFALRQATDVVAALDVASNIVDGYVSERTALRSATLAATKSSVVFQLVSRESNVEQAATQSFKNALRGVPAGYNQQLAHRVFTVTESDVLRVMHSRLKPLFDARVSAMAVTTSMSKATKVSRGLARIGRPIKVVENLSDWFCPDMAVQGVGRNRSIGGAASPDFHLHEGPPGLFSPPPPLPTPTTFGDGAPSHHTHARATRASFSSSHRHHHHATAPSGTSSADDDNDNGQQEGEDDASATDDATPPPSVPAAASWWTAWGRTAFAVITAATLVAVTAVWMRRRAVRSR